MIAPAAQKVGIIGAGVIGDFHAEALKAMTGAELVAAYARRDDKANRFAEQHGCLGYSDLDQFLAHEGMSVVTVASVSGVHLQHVEAAAKAGKHIICEKPLEVTTERIDQMIRICEQAGVMLAGIFPRRFNPSTEVFQRAIENGRLGKVVLVDVAIKWWRSQEYYDSGAWRGTWELDGGGALMNQSIHTIDLMLHLVGPVKSVYASCGLEAHEGIEVEDVAVAMVEFANGARGVIQASTACYSNTGLPASIHVCGDKGSIRMCDDKFDLWDLKNPLPRDKEILERFGVGGVQAGAGAADPKAIDYQWHQRNFEDALLALNRGESPQVDGAEARKAVELIEAIYQSAKAGGEKIVLSN